MTEFVVEFPGGDSTIINVTNPAQELEITLSELFTAYGQAIDMVYRNATDEEIICPSPIGYHTDEWWEGYTCRDCGAK